MTARDEFTKQVEAAEPQLAEAALWIAAEHRAVDVPEALRKLDALADAVRPEVDAARSVAEKVDRLRAFLFERERFRGSREDYYDPSNSYLDLVIERRVGIPITLCVVFIEVARRLGVDADGVGFPGHFLAVVRGDEDILVDAFEGEIVDRDACAARLKRTMGRNAEFREEFLARATTREILLRMLNNLKQIHFQKEEWEAALACCDRMLLLFPDMPLELRDRGLLYQRLECFSAALPDLERFLELAPDHESAAGVRANLEALREKAQRLH